MALLDITDQDGIVRAEDRTYDPGDPIFDLHTDSITAYLEGITFHEARQRRTTSSAQGATESSSIDSCPVPATDSCAYDR